ncbi:FAD binding domain-containing protein [Metarhizium album ARSEF 1941]|uniref:FAD binding domain-containing protein n=1 Tax=Metarhizium album (strain ARSEF 1941) TaxID=1081103 RepID=A0A0B2WU89_METAS|nr:FAD binding domain-containing protein [Metarhizium album ARSEF 1941]KHN97628.1 FAD binding domain-containing protein [Metarhizium album ARSEF 1941]
MAANKPVTPILIIGAGLSGLATGRILTNHGVPNIIFESSPPERSQGFAISLHDWGYMALLEGLGGVSLKSMAKAVAPDRHVGGTGWVDLCMRDNSTGQVLVAPPEKNRPVVMRANRNALRAWIADCGDDELDVRYGHKLKNVCGTPGNMTAVFENGAQYTGSLIIAADGVHSAARCQILPHIAPEVIPVVVYHGEFHMPRQEFDQYINPLANGSNILAGVGDGFNTPITICNMTKSKVYLDWSYSRPARGPKDVLFDKDAKSHDMSTDIPQSLVEELSSLKLAEPWARYVNPETMKQHSVFHWVSRCVYMSTEDARKGAKQGIVFAGDSWHAMPIFGGEGGNHALLDSVELASAIVNNPCLEQAVSAYYDGACKRVQEAVKRSRTRFYVLHRPMAEWQDIAEKRRKKTAQAAKAADVAA